MKLLAEETAALVIDYQEKLIPVINNNEEIVRKTSILIKGLKELEIPIEDDAAMSGLLVALGYHPVPSVIKCRKYYVLDHMTACLDSVEGLGEYLELEILVEQEEDRQQALQQIEERLLSLGYSMQDTTRISYLSMLEKIWEKNGVTYHE